MKYALHICFLKHTGFLYITLFYLIEGHRNVDSSLSVAMLYLFVTGGQTYGLKETISFLEASFNCIVKGSDLTALTRPITTTFSID
jgi:hypothetical protein